MDLAQGCHRMRKKSEQTEKGPEGPAKQKTFLYVGRCGSNREQYSLWYSVTYVQATAVQANFMIRQ